MNPEVIGNDVPHSGHAAILVADDEEIVRYVVERALVADGHEVITAESGDHALAICKARTSPVHLAVIDVVMPGMNGFELFDCLHALWPKVRALFMTGYSAEEAFEKAGIIW